MRYTLTKAFPLAKSDEISKFPFKGVLLKHGSLQIILQIMGRFLHTHQPV